MTVVGRLAVDRPAEVELVNDVGRLEAENTVDGPNDFIGGNSAGAEGVHMHADRVRMANGIGKLNFTFCGQLGGHDIFGNPATHVRRTAVNLRWILAAKGAAPVPAHAAVAVHDNLAARQPSVALRSADDEPAGGVNEKFGPVGQEASWDHFLNHVRNTELFNLAVRNIRRMLGGDDDVGNGDGLAVFIDDGNLGFGIGAQPRNIAGLPDPGEFPSQPVRIHDWSRHEFRSLVAGVTKHQSLIAGPLLGGFLALGFAGVDPLRDIGRLLGDNDVDENLVGMKYIVIIDIADATNGFAGDFDEVQLGFRGDFTTDNHDIGFGVAFAGHAAEFVLGEASVQDGVRNGIADLVGMAFGHGLG